MEPKQDPKSLLSFFEALDVGSDDEVQKCEMHYGCPCIVHRAQAAARMLVAVQEALGLDGAAPSPTQSAPAGDDGAAAAKTEELERQLKEERARAGALDGQIAKLTKDSDRLREHIRMLQRQVDLLHDRREMSSVLNRIEGAEDQPANTAADKSPAPQDPPAGGSVEKSEDTPPQEEKKNKSPLADVLEFEGAMPVKDDPKPENESKETPEPADRTKNP
jgi:TolA-binding protein